MKASTLLPFFAILVFLGATVNAVSECKIAEHMNCVAHIKTVIVDLTDEENNECPDFENYVIDYENCSYTFKCCSDYTMWVKTDVPPDMKQKCDRLEEITLLCDNGDERNDDKSSALGFGPSMLIPAASVVMVASKIWGGGGG
jgi:hypothetical protein